MLAAALGAWLDHDVSSDELSLNVPGELVEGLVVLGATPVNGGDIARSYRLDTVDGPLFVKWHPNPKPDMFAREAAGLRMLREHAPAPLRVPEVLRQTQHGLLLEWIEPGRPRANTEDDCGVGLAGLHRVTNDTFGAIDTAMAGYLGSAEIDLTPTTDWPAFYVERRLKPLVDKAISLGELSSDARRLLVALAPRAAELCGPAEPPALLHGDLWAGNRFVGEGGVNWLIDPACHWGHREIDLAMMQLFGGFGARCFAAYDHTYPLAPGWRERTAWYQLPPLLVHAILFGGAYGGAALAALRRYS